MKQDKWTQQLHDKLAEHETAAPEGLWADIEAALPKQAPVGHTRFVTMRRWAVAASLTAILLGGGYWRWTQKTPADATHETASLTPETVEQGGNGQRNPEMPSDSEALLATVASAVPEAPVTKETTDIADTTVLAEAVVEAETPAITASSTEEETETPQATQKNSTYALPSPSDDLPLAAIRRSRRMPSLNLYASNGFGAQNNADRVMMSPNMADKFNYATGLADQYHAARSKNPIYLAGLEEREKHYQPISFGLTVSYPLTDKLFLTTGAVYTKLRSDFTNLVYDQVTTHEQTLHYIGLPLTLGYQLWNRKGLRVYASAGAQADWNVRAELKKATGSLAINKDRSQWSLNAGLGMQYDLTPQLGIYAEPGVKHYLDNGRKLDNFFKDKPTNFNLQLGLRLNLSR